jgi:DNA-binding NarL/FixJ family response regulator
MRAPLKVRDGCVDNHTKTFIFSGSLGGGNVSQGAKEEAKKMVMVNGVGHSNGHKVATERLPATRLVDSAAVNLGFVRVVYPYYSAAIAGLDYALKKAGIQHGSKPPPGIFSDCIVLCAQDTEHLTEAIENIRKASTDATNVECPILVFAPQNDSKMAEASLRGGARGFIHAMMRPEQILRALSVASKGEIVAPRGLLEFLISDKSSLVDLDALSARQREILEIVAEGCTNAQINGRLFLAESTIKQHLRHAYKILGVKNRTEAAKVMRRFG